MRLREAVPSDSESVRGVHFESITELGLDGYTQDQVNAWAQGCKSASYATAIESDDFYYIVAEDDRGVVGFGSLKFDASGTYEVPIDAEVTAVYVHPTVAREGVGSTIYAELERQAREHGVQMLGLTASLNSVPFYESQGYEMVREHAHEFSSHESTNVEGQVVEMVRRL
ncbi:GNAT family N-acetyltransferase [Haladaptatus sp. DYF46]|uniref:GNAT family N-acetyltransferase n=1 Tax=Haladaptatus sp. DYF46 TaxID=2886041 RepID=UPI001E5F5C4A|nr:GNAT family N-acetyltransferase [Haladaptatus sp. DYF46]